MKTLAKSTIILASIVSLTSCDFFKKNVETETTDVTVVETTTGANIETTEASASNTTTTGINE